MATKSLLDLMTMRRYGCFRTFADEFLRVYSSSSGSDRTRPHSCTDRCDFCDRELPSQETGNRRLASVFLLLDRWSSGDFSGGHRSAPAGFLSSTGTKFRLSFGADSGGVPASYRGYCGDDLHVRIAVHQGVGVGGTAASGVTRRGDHRANILGARCRVFSSVVVSKRSSLDRAGALDAVLFCFLPVPPRFSDPRLAGRP